MNEQVMIKLARYRNYPFTVNYATTDGFKKMYEWSGSKGNQIDIKPVPEEVVQYLMMNTVVFSDGELVVIEDDTAETADVIDNLGEEYKDNAHTRDEIIELLNGNFNKLKSELNKITNKQELGYFCDVAKEIKLDSNSKLALLAELMHIPQDILFNDED